MFEITVFTCEELNLPDGSKLYKLWFALDSGLAWIYSKKKYDKGTNAKLQVVPLNTQDVKTNMRLGIKAI